MVQNSIEKGWDWKQVPNLEPWQQPDGAVKNLIYLLGPDPQKKIYDLGCGIGRHTIFFASQGYDVYASDIAEEAVKSTLTALQKANLHAIVKQGKMTSLEYPNDYFDLLIAYNVIYHGLKTDVEKTIQEILRVLKPQGIFYGTFLAVNEYNKRIKHRIDKKTFFHDQEPEKGVPHYVCEKDDVRYFLKSFQLIKLEYLESIIPQKETHFRFTAMKMS